MKPFLKIKNIRKKLRIFLLIFLSGIGFSIYMIVDSLNGSISLSNFPECINGVMDFEEYDISEEYYQISFAGEIEFYYNEWLVTDELETENKIIAHLPARWSGMNINGNIIPKTGYASYRITMINLPKINISPHLTTDSSYRLYFNRELVGVVGTPSKTEKTEDFKRHFEGEAYRVPDSGEVEVVIEVGYNDYGGLIEFPCFYCYNVWSTGHYAVFRMITALVIGLYFLAMLIALIINFSLEKKGRYILFFLLLGFFLYLINSFDMVLLIRTFEIYLSVVLFEKLSFFSIIVLLNIFIFYMARLKIIKTKLYKYIFPILCICSNILFLFLYGTHFLWIPYVVLLCALAPCAYFMIRKVQMESFDYVYEVILAILLDMIVVSMIDVCEIVIISSYNITTAFSLVFMIVIMVFYFKRLMALNHSELEKRDLAIEALQLKQDNLLKQIKPHLIYNSLEAIQAVYHKDINEGDQGLQYFARYLRTNVDAINGDMISFTEEIDNIINYVNLKNLGIDNKYNLLLEIEYEGFNLPMLSIEPIIENSVKYSKVNLKEDGYIKVSSKKLQDGIIQICIEDNGTGFDVNQVASNSKGLLNAKTRLEIALQAKVTIDSSIGEGTKTIIEFKEINTETSVEYLN